MRSSGTVVTLLLATLCGAVAGCSSSAGEPARGGGGHGGAVGSGALAGRGGNGRDWGQGAAAGGVGIPGAGTGSGVGGGPGFGKAGSGASPASPSGAGSPTLSGGSAGNHPISGTAGSTSIAGAGGGNPGKGGSSAGKGGSSAGKGGAVTGTGGNGAGAGGGGNGAGAGGGGSTGGGPCLGSELLTSVGRRTLLVGGSSDSDEGLAPMDVRYIYITGENPYNAIPCASCTSNPSCGKWWACWQWDQLPPGQVMVTDRVNADKGATVNGVPHSRIPMFTYYAQFQMSGLEEGTPQLAALNDANFMQHYLGDFRFLAQKVGQDMAFFQIEPDLWGYVWQQNHDPHAVPAQVSAVAPECAGFENSAAGMARCMIKLVRVHAPQAKVGLQVSPWVAGFSNTDPQADVAAQARSVAEFMVALGAQDGDFITTDPNSSGEAGTGTPWDVNNNYLPNFHQAFTVSKVITETVGKPLIWWQLPVGNMSLDNTPNHYRDVILDYVFTHTDEVVSAHIVSVLFGPANDTRTAMSTDGGHFIQRLKDYAQSGGQPYCP